MPITDTRFPRRAELPEFIRARDILEHLLPIAPSTLYLWISEGRFPQGTLIGARTRVWSRDEVLAWVKAHV
jgi:predicted DNA-binding transcriptional regulator AlpA